MEPTPSLVFLVDVDNTLLDNDRIIEDMRAFLDREVGPERRRRYWAIFEAIRRELGYADYLGALQRYRLEYPDDTHLLSVSAFLIGYPFAARVYEGAFDALEHLAKLGTTVVLTDGDVVFQPLKVTRSGLADAVAGRVLVYIHKEQMLDDVEARYPAEHYVMVDDKLRILSAMKQQWGARLTTVFVRQGHYATDSDILAAYPPADISVDHIHELASTTPSVLAGAEAGPASFRGS